MSKTATSPRTLLVAMLAGTLALAGAGCKKKEISEPAAAPAAPAATQPQPDKGPASACAACEAQAWATLKHESCDPQISGCGGLAGPEKAKCEAMVACIRRTGCAADKDGDSQPCYCGDASDEKCLGGGAVGPCKAEIELAAGDTTPEAVATRFSDATFAVARAAYLMRCDSVACKGVCAF
jgi:hypothetical protein